MSNEAISPFLSRPGNELISTAPHRGVMDQISDREAMERMVDALDISTRNLGRNGQWLIVGKHGTVQTSEDRKAYVLYLVAHSKRKFSAIKRKLTELGLKVFRDLDTEGTLLLSCLPNRIAARTLRTALGLRSKPSKTLKINIAGVSELSAAGF